MKQDKKKVTGYDKYIDWKIFIIPVVLFFAVLFMPTPYGMKDVGMEYSIAPKKVVSYITNELFSVKSEEAAQWQLLTAQIMEQNMRIGALSKERFLDRDAKWCKKYDIPAQKANLEKAKEYVGNSINDADFKTLMTNALELRKNGLKYENLKDKDKANADKGAWQIKVSIAMGVFVVLCFLTECIPLPAVAFCIGLILVFTGVVSR
ncbi:MAG: sodium:sulfate symporter, partial [Desulfobacter sp.]|nr:sodium:sulfate symporter [Desulfobacter sp.]